MAASITMDIQARVIGYQEAIAKMKAEFAKIDPGSDIGRKLAKAFQGAETQVKNLAKNMFPKASSDNQIDAIIDKVNRAGESILQINQLMQSVGTGDLNLGAFGGDIEEFRRQIAALQEDLTNKLGQGILDAVKGSEELKTVFQDILGVNLDTAKGADLFKAIEKGALSAAKATEQAEHALKDAERKLNENTQVRARIDNGLFGSFDSKTALQNQVQDLERQYEQVFSGVRENIQNKLSEVFSGDAGQQEQILDGFFSGLTPQNIEERIKSLYSTLENAGAYSGNQKRKFYQEVFGVDKANSSYNDVIKSINFEQANQIKDQFKNLINSFSADMNRPVKLEIESLIDSNSLQTAAEKTEQEIDRIFNRLHKKYTESMNKLPMLEEAISVARANLAQAQEKQGQITGASNDITRRMSQLEETLKAQQQEINSLKQSLEQAKGRETQKIQEGARSTTLPVQEQIFPTDAAAKYQAQLDKVQAQEKLVGKIEGVAQRWFSVYAVVRMVSNAIRSVISTIRELDKTITEIAIVTSMDQSSLWGQMSSYTDLANKYAASISGVYKVSQLYYQQGLQTADVMALTEQTLKMARISGLDYADATDYMTNAIRSFKMEMQDAQVVVDTYSAVAASSATNVTELASAMSKTASSAQAVGSSLQNTTAMLAVMIEATRESPENIGSAMKSIISRYGELKENKTGMDAEGEEYSLNKVDKALQSIGVSIHDVNGEFRDFDDVIFELAEKWDTVDKNTQRYIATVMAGNRQQSRFLALVSSNKRLQEESEIANNSEDAAQLQYLKVLDGVEAKVQNLQNALQSLYLNSGFETAYKNLIDFGTGVIKVFSSMNTWAKQPIPAIIAIGTTFYNVANVFTTVFSLIKTKLTAKAQEIQSLINLSAQQGTATRISIEYNAEMSEEEIMQKMVAAYRNAQKQMTNAKRQGVNERNGIQEGTTTTGGKISGFLNSSGGQAAVSVGSSVLSLVGTTISANLQNAGNKQAAGWVGVGSSTLSGVAMGSAGGWVGMLIGGIAGAIMGLIQNWGNIFQSAEDKLKDLQEQAEKANNDFLQKKSETQNLNKQITQLKELEKHRYDSIEAEEAYYEAANKMGEIYPTLISAMDEAGNVTIDLFNAENELTKSRNEAIKAARTAAVKNFKVSKQSVTNAKENATEDFGGKTDLFDFYTSDSRGMNQYIADYVAFKRYQRMGLNKSMTFEQAKDSKIQSEELYLPGLSEFYDFTDLPQLKYFETGKFDTAGYSSYDLENSYFYNEHDFPLSQELDKLEESLRNITNEAEKQSYRRLIDITRKALKEPTSINEQDFNDFQLIDDSYFTGTANFMYAAAKFAFQKFEKGTQEIRQAEATMSSTIESELAKIIGASSIGSKNTFQGQLINSSGILTNLAMNELKSRAVNGEITEELWTNMVGSEDGETEGDIDSLLFQWNEELEFAWSKLTTSKKDQINNLLKNANRYSSAQLKTELQNIGFEIDENITQAIINSAQSKLYDIEKFQQKFNDRVTQRNNAEKTYFDSIFNALSADNAFGSDTEEWGFGSAELEAMANLQDEIDNYVDNGKMSIEQANNFIDNYVKILKSVDILPTELREKAQKLIFDNKDWSITGLYELADLMAEIGIDEEVLQQVRGLSNYVPKNLVADLDSFTNSITSKFEDFQKALKNASDGMDLKNALKFVDKLGMSLNDLDFKNGKFYTKHDFEPADIETAYLNWNRELYTQLESNYIDLFNLANLTDDSRTHNILENYANIIKDPNFNHEQAIKWFENQGINLSPDQAILLKQLYEQYFETWKNSKNALKDANGNITNLYDFDDYVREQLTQSYENAQAALQTASEYEINSFLLRNGGIEAFVKQIGRQETDDKGEITRQGLDEAQKKRLTAAIRAGDLTSLQDDELLWSYVRQYVDVVGDAFKDVQKQLGEALLASFEDGGPKTIEVTKENLEVIKAHKGLFDLTPDQEIKEGDILTFQDIQTFKADNTLFNSYILAISSTQKEALENLQKYHKALYGTKFKDISSLLNETTSVGYDEFTNYLASIGKLFTTDDNGKKIFGESELAEYGVKISELTGDFIITDLNKYISKLEADLGTLNDSNSSVQERNEIKAKIASARSQQAASQKKATEDILKSYDSISVEQREAFANAFKVDFDANALNKIFKDNYDGTFKLDVNELQKYLREKGNTISSATRNYLNELIAKIADDYLAKIEIAASYIVKGTTKQEDMAKIVSEFNKRYNTEAIISDLFKWDDILEAFTFKPEYLQYYIQMQREELAKAGFNDDQIEAYINNQIKQITNAIDITGFYGSENRGVGSKSRQTLRNQISAALFANAKFQSENFEDYLDYSIPRSHDRVVMAEQKAQLAKEDNERLVRELNQQSDNLFAAINSGGQVAIEAMKTLYQSQELSAEQVEAAYRAQLNNFSNAFDAIESLSINSVVDQNTREILNQIDGFVVSSDGVVLAVGNMIDAYKQLYENMKQTAVATTTELNTAYAKYLTTQDQQEIDAVEVISNASGITYEAFGNMLTQYGFSLEQAIKNQAALGIEQTGTGKIRITDFTKFTSVMGWEPNSEEYIDALKSYNDYLIEFNTKTKDSIKSEFESLATAKGGDWLNLTNLFNDISKELTPNIKLQLLQAGAVFSDGILKTTDNANFLTIAKILQATAEAAGQELSDEFKDVIESIIKAYSDAIIKGIKGSLTNVEAGNLINQAKNLGIGLDESSFIKTEEGLKLAQDKAIELYYALQRVDAIQAHLVFKELNDSLEKSNEHYKSIATIQAHIIELQNKINEADAKTNPARKKQYEEELKLAKEIAQIRLTTEDSSFDFMSTPLNGALNNAPTYWEAWSKAVSVVEDANKNNYMGWQDFAHLIQGVQDLAVQTGKDMEFMGVTFNKEGTTAGELIEQGFSALKVDPESKQAVLDLDNLMSATGLQFSQGADGFSADVQEGIREYARGQVEMLDGMIQMLETVVAMEKLGDIAGEDGDNEIEISDILPKIDFDDEGKVSYAEFGKIYDETIVELQNLLKTNKDFAEGAKQFKINNISFEEIIGMSPKELASQGENFLKAYVAAIKAFTEAEGDWDTAFDLLQEKLLSLNLADGTEFEFGGTTYYYTNSMVLEKKGDKFVVNGKEYEDTNSAIQAIKTNEAAEALRLAPKSTTNVDGTLNFKVGTLDVTVAYNVKDGYSATFADGLVITSTTKEGLNLGILSWAKNKGVDTGNIESSTDGTVIDFMIKGTTYKVNVNGEVEVEGEDELKLEDKVKEAVQETMPKETKAETATDMTVNVTNLTINPQNVKVDTESTENTSTSNVEINADTVTVKTKGATVTLDVETIKPTNTYPVEVTASEISVNTALVNGQINLSDCTFTLVEDGNAVIKSGDSVIAEIPISGLTGVGIGTLSSGDCTFSYSENDGKVKVTFTNGTVINVPLPDGEGTGTLPQGNCTYSYDETTGEVKIIGLNETSFSFNLNEKGVTIAGTGSYNKGDFTYKYDPNTGEIMIIGADGLSFNFDIPSSSTVTGTGSFGADSLWYEYETSDDGTSTIHITGLDDKEYTFTIPEEVKAKGNGSIVDGDLTFEYKTDDKGTKTVEVTGLDNQTFTFTVPDTTSAKGTCSVKKDDIAFTYSSSIIGGAENVTVEFGEQSFSFEIPADVKAQGTYTVTKDNIEFNYTTADNGDRTVTVNGIGTAPFTFTVPATTPVNGTAIVTQIEAQWKEGISQYDTSQIKNDPIDLGTREGTITLSNVKIIEGQDVDNKIAQAREAFRTPRAYSQYGLTSNEFWTSGLINPESGQSTPTKLLTNYVNALYDMVNAGQELDSIDISNLEFLFNSDKPSWMGENQDYGTAWSNIFTQVGLILDTVNSRDTQISRLVEQLSLISQIQPTNIVQLSQAIQILATNASVLETLDWNKIVENLQTLNGEENQFDITLKIDANLDSAIQTIKTVDLPERTINIKGNYIGTEGLPGEENDGSVGASGNVGLAKAQGTLMGELGPELYVQNGRYFVAGQNGPEFVDLAPDAIVFNHLQTRSLLDKGMSPGRGKAVTNERNAVSYAKGNVNGGPAMASASAALAALKKLRAQWEALMNMSVADLAGKGGGGGGGGDKDLPGFIRDVERWYNWLQKIADLEKQINYEESLRNKIQSDMISNGKAYYASQKRQLKQLEDSVTTSSSLYLSQLEYFKKRQDELNNNSPLRELYTFDDSGQLHYQEGSYQWLAQLFKTNDYGALELTPKQQYEMILARNPQFAQYMKYNSEGKEIKQEDYKGNKDQYYLDMVKAFSDRMDSEKEEMQNLFDSFNEQAKAVNEKLQKQNELIQAMKDNQKEVEEAVLGAIVESRERQIKELQDTKDALQKSNQDFIDGLSKQLDKEQKMYQNSQKDQELQRNRRQLAILQRSGASASQIAALQKQIEQQSQDEYFTKQQEQIDAVKEASDLQIERLDHQIEIEQEQLEYEKANGLLWSQVYEVMAKTPEEISAFIQENTAAEWAKSPLSSTEAANDWIFKTEQWTEYRDDIHGIYDALTAAWNMFDESMKQMFGSGWEGLDDETKKSLQNKFMQVYQETGDYNEAAKAIQQTDVYQQLKKKQDEETASQYQETEKPESPKDEVKITSVGKWEYDAQNHWRTIKYSNGNSWVQKEPHKYKSPITNASKCTVCGRQVSQYSPQSSSTSGTSAGAGSGLTISGGVLTHITPTIDPHMLRYASGGLIDYTGPAWVDGTPQEPESIWDAETTKLMRDNLLNPRSLNLLGTFWDTLQGYQSATNHSYSNNSESLVIENAVVNMNVASIADDYDARRAGEQAMEEMIKIARKTSVSSFKRG